MKINVLLPLLLIGFQTIAQQADSLKGKLEVYGSLDIYYAYDFNEPDSRERPSFLYSHTKHNNISINTAVLGVRYENEFLRGTVALLVGDYSVTNYAAEEQLFQNIYEAYLSVKLADHLWLDAGVFSSHIGIEGGVGPGNPTLTRSLVAHSSPFFESGIKLGYQPNDKWFFSALVLNGWQNISETNNAKALGTQITFQPKNNLTLNSSTYIGEGNNAADNLESFRFFHNFYLIWEPTSKVYLAFALDVGSDKLETRANGEYQNWWGTSLIANYQLNSKWKLIGRLEYFDDPGNVIFTEDNVMGPNLTGISAGFDFSPIQNLYFRSEGKFFSGNGDLFEKKNEMTTDSNFSFFTSLGILF
ncbi:MAG: porin [Flammeovirgaceae bacterium]|nr:porin [Flammeovirgaceae bacterium]